jgi:hypothetical protein
MNQMIFFLIEPRGFKCNCGKRREKNVTKISTKKAIGNSYLEEAIKIIPGNQLNCGKRLAPEGAKN